MGSTVPTTRRTALSSLRANCARAARQASRLLGGLQKKTGTK